MSLDFVVLGQNGAPEKTVSLGVDLHHQLITVASSQGLKGFQVFEDYYEDAEVAVEDLSGLVDQVQALRVQTSSIELQSFLGDLTELIACAMATGRAVHTIAD